MKIPSALHNKRRYALQLGVLALIGAGAACASSQPASHAKAEAMPADTVSAEKALEDSLRYVCLTLQDYEDVAKELDIPVAAIRAVVEIEAGPGGEGFNPDHTPLINFDLTMFRQSAKRHGINLDKYRSSHATVFKPLDRQKYGSTQAAQYARLKSAMGIDTVAAIEGTFWGMFQIGGFNWKLCGCTSPREFVELMSYSEREQLELFAAFIRERNLVGYIRKKQWAEFALRYNGPGYKKHRYDSRLKAAFQRFSD